MKSPNLRHGQACSENKGLSECQRRASPLQTGSSPAVGREAGGRQPQLERGKLGPREASSTKLQAGTQSLTKTSWDSGQLTSAWKITSRDQFLEETHSTGDGRAGCYPGNPVAGIWEVRRCSPYLGRLRSPSTWSPELLGPGKGTKRRPNPSAPLWSPREPEPEQLRPGKCTQPRPASDSSLAEKPRA